MALSSGQIIGQYRILEKIGEGGMGAVYTAEQSGVHRTVVLKVLSANVADNPEMLDRFKRELDIIAQLENPHILPVYDFGQYENNPYIVMRFMGGGSLLDGLRARSLTREQILNCFDQIAAALDYAHGRHIIHRDLKPANVLLDERANAYLADFGLAKTLEGSAELTKTGSVLGTPAYMSPEQARGDKLDARADIYALGVMAFEALAGQQPFTGKTAWELIKKQLTEPPPSIISLNADLPLAVEETINHALAKNRDERPAHAGDFVKDLRVALADTPTLLRSGASLSPQPSTRGNVAGATAAQSAASVKQSAVRTRSASSIALPRTAAVAIPAALLLIVLGVVVVVAVGGIGTYLFRDQLFGPQVAVYPVGDSPRAILWDGQAIWVANGSSDSVTKLPATNCDQTPDPCGQALGAYPVDVLPIGLAYDGQFIWVASGFNSTLSKLEPESGEVIAPYNLVNIPSAILYAHNSLWLANGFSGTVTQANLGGETVAEYEIGGEPVALAADQSSVWVASKTSGELTQIDGSSGEALNVIQIEGQPVAMTFDGQHIWVAVADKNWLLKLDPVKPEIVETVATGNRPVAVAFDGRRMWVANQSDATVTGFESANTEAQTTYSVNNKPFALAAVSCGADCTDLWIVSEASDTVSRIRIK